jgi:hypothetical protein
MRGRASAAHSLAAMSANGLGQAEVGFMSDLIGADRTMFLGGAVSIIVVFLIWWLVKGVRQYRFEEVPSETAADFGKINPENYKQSDLRSHK